jgi:hypothetical protein
MPCHSGTYSSIAKQKAEKEWKSHETSGSIMKLTIQKRALEVSKLWGNKLTNGSVT